MGDIGLESSIQFSWTLRECYEHTLNTSRESRKKKKNNAKLILKASVYVHNAEKGTWRKPKPNSNLSSVLVENLNFNNRHITAVPILNPQVIIICSLLEEHWCNSYCFSCLAYCIHCTCRPQFYSYVSEKTEFKFLQGALRDHYVSVE